MNRRPRHVGSRVRARSRSRAPLGALAVLVGFAVSVTPGSAQRTITRTELSEFFPNRDVRLVTPTTDTGVRFGIQSVTLRPGTYLTAVTSANPQVIRSASGLEYRFPERLLGVDNSGSRVLLQAVVRVSQDLRWLGDDEGFRGAILVGVRDNLAPTTAKTLSPISVRITAPSADSVIPGAFTIRSTNTSGFQPVELSARDPGDSLLVNLITDYNEGELHLPLRAPTLGVEVSPRRIRGLGLEEAEVRVTVTGAPTAVEVGLSADDGRLDPSSVTVDPGTGAIATIRSRGWGGTTIRANRSSFVQGTAALDYYFPVLFVLLVIGGGVAGAWLRSRQTARSDPEASFGWRAALSGVLTGALLAFAFGIGIRFDWLPIPPGVTDVGALLVAAVGGWVGPAVMSWLSGLKTADAGTG